ncbi:MAG: hypothetical protein NBV65_11645, partial [Burkholderiaceae bacterium]|nr:hypothetical protein [Burkholderiaceae bacterium]
TAATAMATRLAAISLFDWVIYTLSVVSLDCNQDASAATLNLHFSITGRDCVMEIFQLDDKTTPN